MSEKKKVLIVTESISYGGLNIASVKFEEYLDKTKYECIYCVRRSALGELENTVTERGIRVIHVPDNQLNYFKSYLFYKKLMKEEHFDVVHCHLPFFSGIVLFAAYKNGVPKRVAHGHFTQPYTDVEIYSKPKQFISKYYRKVMRLFLKKYCNTKIACSKEAGEYLFGKKEFEKHGIVLNNGIDTEKYSYNVEVRSEVRKELDIKENAFVLGHIGQLYSVKNQSFVIDVFSEYHKINGNSVLLLVGDGSDREKLIEKSKSLGLNDCIFFLGLRNDTYRLYQAMDCFILPSLHEGFPLTLIEAQASNLLCAVSKNVNIHTKINENVEFISLERSPKDWAEILFNYKYCDRSNNDNCSLLKEYDIRNTVNKLDKLYSN